MTTLEHQIRIAAPTEQVFATLANLETVAEYNPAVLTARYITSERSGVGTARECDLGKQGTVRERVTGFEHGRSISMEMYEHNWPLEFMRWTTEVKPDGAGTSVSQKLSYRMKFGLLGAVLDQMMMRRKLDSTLNEVFHAMRDYIEKAA